MKYFPLFLLLFSCSPKTMPNRIHLGEAFYNCNIIAAGLQGVANLDETEIQLRNGHWNEKTYTCRVTISRHYGIEFRGEEMEGAKTMLHELKYLPYRAKIEKCAVVAGCYDKANMDAGQRYECFVKCEKESGYR